MHFSRKHALRIGEILSQAAVTEIMPRFQRLAADQVRQKSSSFDLVTEADEAAERVISDQLRAAFPGCIIVGEEATAKDPALLEGIADAELAFIVDPIDGTRNFVSGLPLFGVMLAATVKGEVVLSAIHEPVREDTAFALRGEGAWIETKDGRTVDLRVADSTPLSEMEAMVSTSYLAEPLRSVVNGNLSRIGLASNLRCAAHEYRLAAAGHCHLLFYNKLMPWDHAPGWLLHREAGGYGAHFDGSDYRPAHFSGGLICAPDRESWQLARDALLGNPERRS
jgi:fructose-1,6-bisphosphatase/inositol monophosphatase family enzyme